MSTALATRPGNDLAAFLNSKSSELSAICGKSLTAQRVIQLAVLCAYKTPRLLDCDRGSVLACVCQAASLNLDLNPSSGEAYLIPRKNKNLGGGLECTLQIGYQGLAKCARSSGAVRVIQGRAVREGDHFKVIYHNDTPNVVHEPKMSGEAGTITHVYATARLATGETQVEVMSAEEVEHVREKYADKDSRAWEDSWGEMAKKTVLRRLCKSLPKSDELVKAIELHDSEFVVTSPAIEGPKERVDNGSGYGKGTYAEPEKVTRWLARAKQFLDERNQRWCDHWANVFRGDIPNDVPSEVCRIFQLDNHLCKWAIRVGHLKEGSADETGIREHQLGKLTALLFFKKSTQKQLIEEAFKYVDEQERILVQKIAKKHPELDEQAEEGSDDDAAVDAAMDEIASQGGAN
jgi:recombination protein RecT